MTLNILNEHVSNGDDIDDGEEIIAVDAADDSDPGGIGASAPIPGDIQAEPGFLVRFSNRFHQLLNDEIQRIIPKFSEFESLCDDLLTNM